MNKENTGAPWQPLTGLIDPFESGPNNEPNESNELDEQERQNYDSYKDTPNKSLLETFSETPNELRKKNTNINVVRSQTNTPIEKTFLYIAMLLCTGLLIGLIYWVMNKHLFYSLLIVLVSIILYCLVYIANFKDYIENSNTHEKVTSGWTIVTLALTTIMLLIVVKNKGRFT